MKTGDSLNINLLPSQAKFQAARIKLKKTIRYYMTLVSVLWVAVAILVVVLYFGSDFVLKQQNKKYETSMSSFENMSEEIAINQLLKYRAKVLGQVLNERFEYSTAFETVASVFSEKAKVSEFKFESKSKEFKMTVLATDKETVDYVEDRVLEVNEGKVEGVKHINIISVAYVIGGDWSIDMEVKL